MKPAHDAGRMTQLDTLRAVAVVSVAVSHWTPNFLVGIVPWGTAVQLFFVLSGFLITGILLRSRPAESGSSMPAALGTFYMRRFLRIFPLYYGVLTFALVFGVGPIYETWPWHFSYLSNIYYARFGHDTSIADPFLHLWSLSVEEQFYLLWPLIALVASPRILTVVLYGAIVVSMAFRVSIDHFLPHITSVRYLTPSCLDAFAIGGLIAHARHYQGDAAVRRLTWGFSIVGILGLVLSVFILARTVGSENARRIGHTFLVIFYGAVVAGAARGFGGIPGRLMTIEPVLYLGRISYGVYVFHHFAPAAMHWVATRWNVEALQRPPVLLTAYAVFTLVLAVLSWHLYELPINRLKRHFDYPRPNPSGPAATKKISAEVPTV
jgi:peptidoglycan/LPS O-acetylase OafA/YrhL